MMGCGRLQLPRAKADQLVWLAEDHPYWITHTASQNIVGILAHDGIEEELIDHEPEHQVRLPLISVRGLMQTGSGLDCVCSFTQRWNSLSTAVLA